MKIIRKTAGWWKIKDIESGQIDWDQPDKKGLLMRFRVQTMLSSCTMEMVRRIL